MRLEFAYTAEDLWEAAIKRPGSKHTGRWRKGDLGWVVFVANYVLLLIWLKYNSGPAGAFHSTRFLLFLLLMPALGVLIPLYFWMGPRMCATRLRNDPELSRPRTVEFDQTGIQVVTSSRATHLAWSAFARAAETRNLILLYLRLQNGVVSIPKRAARDESSLHHIRELIRKNVH